MSKDKSNEPNPKYEVLKECFIITPIGGHESEIFKKADGLIKSVIKPVLAKFNFEAVPAYEIDASGSITKQVIEHIINDELVIANLTGLNPNVMYELAIRHSYKKKVVIMAEYGTILPFDISDQRAVLYNDTLHGSENVKPRLAKAVKEVLESAVTSNQIIDSIKEAALISSLEEKDGTTKYLLERFDRIERAIINYMPVKSFDDKVKYYGGSHSEHNQSIIIKGYIDKSEDYNIISVIAHNYGLNVSFGTNGTDNTKLRFDPIPSSEIIDSLKRDLGLKGFKFE